jgi:uncharacterized OB-fold protein
MTNSLPSPDPLISLETAPFWEATTRGELLIGRCTACASYIWYPRSICPFCMSSRTELVPARGGGHVHSFTVTRRGAGPYRECTPYVLAYVELDEGPRMLTNIVGAPPEEVAIGARVEVVFEPTDKEWSLPRFALAGAAS